MTKLSRFKLSENTKNNLIKQFWFALSEIDKVETVEDFFKRLLTPTEIVMLAKRLDVLKYLSQGSSYEQIRSELKVTDNTIAKLNNLLHGEDPNFLKVLEKLTRNQKRRSEQEINHRQHPHKASKKVWP